MCPCPRCKLWLVSASQDNASPLASDWCGRAWTCDLAVLANEMSWDVSWGFQGKILPHRKREQHKREGTLCSYSVSFEWYVRIWGFEYLQPFCDQEEKGKKISRDIDPALWHGWVTELALWQPAFRLLVFRAFLITYSATWNQRLPNMYVWPQSSAV